MHDFQVLEIIVETVARVAHFSTPKKLYEDNRSPALVKLRDTTLFLVRQKTKLSLPEIGRVFGKDHSSILSAIRRETLRLDRNPPRHDGLTWQAYHEKLSTEIDKAVSDAVAVPLVN